MVGWGGILGLLTFGAVFSRKIAHGMAFEESLFQSELEIANMWGMRDFESIF
jgi:hypothetical protein